MIEIIKRGFNPLDQTYMGTCNLCHTQIRFKRSDAIHRDGLRGSMQGGSNDTLSVQCPVCDTPITVAA